jgi:hypothetical protein
VVKQSVIFGCAWSVHARRLRSLVREGPRPPCLDGELHTELEDGRTFVLKPGVSYQVADNKPHRSSAVGAKLFIVD